MEENEFAFDFLPLGDIKDTRVRPDVVQTLCSAISDMFSDHDWYSKHYLSFGLGGDLTDEEYQMVVEEVTPVMQDECQRISESLNATLMQSLNDAESRSDAIVMRLQQYVIIATDFFLKTESSWRELHLEYDIVKLYTQAVSHLKPQLDSYVQILLESNELANQQQLMQLLSMLDEIEGSQRYLEMYFTIVTRANVLNMVDKLHWPSRHWATRMEEVIKYIQEMAKCTCGVMNISAGLHMSFLVFEKIGMPTLAEAAAHCAITKSLTSLFALTLAEYARLPPKLPIQMQPKPKFPARSPEFSSLLHAALIKTVFKGGIWEEEAAEYFGALKILVDEGLLDPSKCDVEANATRLAKNLSPQAVLDSLNSKMFPRLRKQMLKTDIALPDIAARLILPKKIGGNAPNRRCSEEVILERLGEKLSVENFTRKQFVRSMAKDMASNAVPGGLLLCSSHWLSESDPTFVDERPPEIEEEKEKEMDERLELVDQRLITERETDINDNDTVFPVTKYKWHLAWSVCTVTLYGHTFDCSIVQYRIITKLIQSDKPLTASELLPHVLYRDAMLDDLVSISAGFVVKSGATYAVNLKRAPTDLVRLRLIPK